MFRAIDQGGEKVLIVLYSSHKVGAREYNNLANVYRWTGAQFERVESVELALASAKTAAEVDKWISKLIRRKNYCSTLQRSSRQ